METIVRRDLGITLDPKAVMRVMHVTEDFEDEFMDIFNECVAVSDPAYAYTTCDVSQDEKYTCIGGERFDSRVMLVNFKGVTKAYPYVSTCGRALYDLAKTKDDPLERFWVDGIAEQTLYKCNALTLKDVKEFAGSDKIFSMNPGSLADFPLTNQRPLFSLLGDVEKLIGAWLTDSCLILPYKSCSGFYFESEHHFVNCALCPREGCPNRRAPFDEAQFSGHYGLGA